MTTAASSSPTSPRSAASAVAQNFVVLKFGGTSVSSVANWHNIATVLRARLADGLQPVVVHSALSGITDRLEQLLALADGGDGPRSDWQATMNQIETRHRELAAALGVTPSAELEEQFKRLRQISSGIALVGEVSERLRARVMAQGELMATRLGASFLAAQGFAVEWLDARTVLKAEVRRNANTRSSYLSATCKFEPDVALQARLAQAGAPQKNQVWITQGFIASDDAGDTVLLGRGGSDTSGSYFAAKLAAKRLEIWTDVPGMFSANPRSVPTARLLRALEYDEAQEIASSGAKVLHPRCLMPVKQYGIPLYVYATQTPNLEGTEITTHGGDGEAHVKAVTIKKGITLVSMETVGMWHQVGFLADAFAVFKDHGLSVDLVSTSETNVTVSLDPAANALNQSALNALVADLAKLCRVEVFGPCAAVSLVGRRIRAILHKLGEALELFEEQKIYLVTQAANDLNLTFVVDEEQGDRLVTRLHEITIHNSPDARILGPTWQQLYAPAEKTVVAPQWWQARRDELLKIGAQHGAAYVYDRATVLQHAQALQKLPGIRKVLFAMKANPNRELLKALDAQGIDFDCVAPGEVQRLTELFPTIDRARILFTLNFAPRSEYEWGFEQGVRVTLDNLHPLKHYPDVFKGRDVFVRIDTGTGRGHHDKVRTAGIHSKFGIPMFELDELERLVKHAGARIVGLHAHTGSGVFNVENWREVGEILTQLTARFPAVTTVDLGGGLGVPEKATDPNIDLNALGAVLGELHKQHPKIAFWLEPGRYLVAQAGVLLAQVTQTKGKGEVQYVGVATGMNSLIRPALYGAHHDIVNLTRLDEPASEVVNVVGPICESGDQLGNDRLLPPSQEGDVLLIANAGAYGFAMSSNYNLRAPAVEIVI